MKRSWLTALTASFAAAFLLPVSAAAAPELVDICHRTADAVPDEGEWIHIRVNVRSVEKHEFHGDGHPGGSVPGTDGVVFDQHCDPQTAPPPTPTIPDQTPEPPADETPEPPADETPEPPADETPEPPTPPESSELVFAVAYSDMDPNDGGYRPDVDTLIAKLVDGPDDANDGVPGIGDLIITDQYPEDFGPTEFGAFGTEEPHVVTDFVSGTDYLCRVESGAGIFVWSSGEGDFDQYQEWSSVEALTRLYDDRSSATLEEDEILITSTSPSHPTTDVALGGPDLTDQTFIDVEADCSLATP